MVMNLIPWTWPGVLLFYVIRIAELLFYKWYHNAEALDSVDGMWLIEGPKNRIIINALLVTKGEIHFEHLQEVLLKKLRINDEDQYNNPYKKVKQRILIGYIHYYWVDVEDFKLSNHLKLWPDTIQSKTKLRHLVSTLCSRELDKSKSPWEYIVIPYIDDLGKMKAAHLMRAHHCLADGVSLARFLMKELPDVEAVSVPLRKFSERNRLLLMLKGLFWGPYYLANMITLPSDSSLLHGRELSGCKTVTWSEPIDLSIIKEIKNRTSSTVNDVIVSCLTAAIREFYNKKHITPPSNLKVSIPIDLRENMDQAAVRFENKFAIMPLQLATAIKDPLAMLSETKRRFNELKTSGEPFSVSMAMKVFTKLLPSKLMEPANRFICEKTTAVLSNVPGPQNRLKIAGCELDMLTFWAPQKNNIGLSFSLGTYANQLILGVMSDVAVLKDPDEICREYNGQVMELRNQLGEINQNLNEKCSSLNTNNTTRVHNK